LPDLRDLIGIPFIHNGRDPKQGLDCLGLVVETFKRFGIQIPDLRQACYDAITIQMAILGEVPRWIKIIDPTPPCAVVMAIDPEMPGVIQHLGTYIGDGKVLHTINKIKSSIFTIDGASLNDSFWTKKIKGYYKWDDLKS
jgi:cell wall-associated NlpC family hydrolase